MTGRVKKSFFLYTAVWANGVWFPWWMWPFWQCNGAWQWWNCNVNASLLPSSRHGQRQMLLWNQAQWGVGMIAGRCTRSLLSCEPYEFKTKEQSIDVTLYKSFKRIEFFSRLDGGEQSLNQSPKCPSEEIKTEATRRRSKRSIIVPRYSGPRLRICHWCQHMPSLGKLHQKPPQQVQCDSWHGRCASDVLSRQREPCSQGSLGCLGQSMSIRHTLKYATDQITSSTATSYILLKTMRHRTTLMTKSSTWKPPLPKK